MDGCALRARKIIYSHWIVCKGPTFSSFVFLELGLRRLKKKVSGKNWPPLCRDGQTPRIPITRRVPNRLVLAVMLGVMTARLGMMFFGVAGMAVGAVRVVGGLLVVAGFMVLGGFAVMLGGVFVMFGGLVVVFDCVFAHLVRSRSVSGTPSNLRTSPDGLLTVTRQVY